MLDLKLWRQFVKFAKQEHPEMPVSWEQGTRKALMGKCPHAAKVLADLIEGEVLRGFYHGHIDLSNVFHRISVEPNGSMHHSWVEKDGRIYDPTFWQFEDAPLGIYVWDVTDPRYRREDKSKIA